MSRATINTTINERKKKPTINRDWCKGCRICVEFCPEDALVIDEQEKAKLVYLEQCSGCGLCELRCPDLAIEIQVGVG